LLIAVQRHARANQRPTIDESPQRAPQDPGAPWTAAIDASWCGFPNPPAHTSAMRHTLFAYAGWWIEARCGCRAVQLPVRLILQERRPESTIEAYARELRCPGCGERPVCELVDDVQTDTVVYPRKRVPVRIRI
jgi:hypothetical protein